jgi:hypothetical protein
MPTTPNMGMLLPDPTITPGPTYASENNGAFDVIDSHDHTSGKGLPVPSNGLNINGDLPFNNFNATTIRAARFQSQTSPLTTPSDLSQLYVVNGNLFYNNQLGQQVQITVGNALDATSIGGIGGDYATSTALEFYTTSIRTFTFWSANNVPANLDAGSITIREIATNPFGITVSSPPSLPAAYTLVLPSALPSATSALQVDSVGNISFSGGVAPSGSIIMWGGASAPAGWLLCNGTSYLRTAQPGIFAAIGTAYGAADGTHFNVPDFRGIFPRGVDSGAGNDPDTLTRSAQNPGGNTGDNVGSFQEYNVQLQNVQGSVGSGTGPNFFGGGAHNFDQPIGGSETRPINLYINFIIKT